MKNAIIILFVGMLFVFQSNAQNPSYVDGSYERVELKDGSSIIGTVIEEDNEQLIIKLKGGNELIIQKTNIEKRFKTENIEGTVSEKYKFKNPNPTRYYFSPSAINLKKGEGYYQNVMVGFNSINYGVTDYFTIGGGVELYSSIISLTSQSFGGRFTPLLFINPKVGFEVAPKVHLGGGVLFVTLPSYDIGNVSTGFNYAGIGYGVATYGSIEHNATLGIGYAFENGDAANRPIFMLGGMTRMNSWLSLVTENYFIPVANAGTFPGVIGYGARFMNRRLSFDLMFFNHPQLAQLFFIGFPALGLVYKF